MIKPYAPGEVTQVRLGVATKFDYGEAHRTLAVEVSTKQGLQLYYVVEYCSDQIRFASYADNMWTSKVRHVWTKRAALWAFPTYFMAADRHRWMEYIKAHAHELPDLHLHEKGDNPPVMDGQFQGWIMGRINMVDGIRVRQAREMFSEGAIVSVKMRHPEQYEVMRKLQKEHYDGWIKAKLERVK